MARRPDNLDLSGAGRAPRDHSSPRNRFNIDLPSPRVGEIPPALSPLDAFAQQSRLLAKKFEESQQKGKRISRLDHLEVANEFGKRPVFFRSASSVPQSAHIASGDDEDEDDVAPPLPHYPQKSQTPAAERPISHYPQLGVANEGGHTNIPSRDLLFRNGQPSSSVQVPDNYFGIQVPRADSPEGYEKVAPVSPKVPSLSGSIDSLHSSQPRTNTDDSYRPNRGLAPPASPTHPSSKKSLVSIRSIMDNADEELQPPRKFSESSQVSRARSPFTPDAPLGSRSPSIRSDHSAFQDDLRRPSFNFSRPLSSSGNKDFSQFRSPQSPQQSFEADRNTEGFRDRSPLSQKPYEFPSAMATPVRSNHGAVDASSQSGDESSMDATPGGAPSYIYAKYSLPRGRVIERSSLGEQEPWARHQYKWEEAAPDTLNGHPSIPPSPSPSIAERRERPFRPALQLQNARSHSADGRGPITPRGPVHRSTPSSPSVYSHSTDRTIRAHSKNSPSQEIVNMSAEEHLEKGIECHSSGALSKSTYHLRLAARAGHPTGMLLYALACRHGWGMRPNQTEGVQWLKKAVDSSSLEMLEISEGNAPASSGTNVQQSKSRKAQFALAIYELGMSYMNGWGTSKDKSLAVRCFEVAGNWGDCDALAEAAFCYAQGIGCKKDLKKAAALYRRAADAGMSMAGNSWIYKEKYMDKVPDSPNPSISEKSGKPARSRARSIFGRKKSAVNA